MLFLLLLFVVDLYKLLLFLLLLVFVLVDVLFVLELSSGDAAMRLGTLRLRSAAKRCTAQYTTAIPNASDPRRECAKRLRRYVHSFPVMSRDVMTIERQYVATVPWCAAEGVPCVLSGCVVWVRGEEEVREVLRRVCSSWALSLAVCISLRHVVHP